MATRGWKLLIGALWAALIGYALVAAPPADPVLERALWTGHFARVDASVVALFLLLGVNADLYIVLLLRDGRFQRVPGWPFGIAMFVLGSFVLVPYLLLRSPRPPRQLGRVTRVLSSRPIGWLLVAAMLALASWGITAGSATAFVAAFRTSALVHVMTLDFALEVVLLWPLVEELRRLEPPAREPHLLRFMPLLGPALWNALVVR